MIMPRGSDQLLLPVNPFFIGLTLLAALGFEMLPLGRHPAAPDLMALTLVFWNVHQPHRVGIGLAFAFGLAIDVNHGAALGQHALAYTLLSYGAVSMHRRLLWFSIPEQAAQILPLFAGAHVVSLLARLAAGGMFPGWSWVVAPLIESLLWPVAVWLLLAPQRRAPDPDKNRPL
ncbi:MAG: rod shape-determining protein MreD [Aquabacterium sp.]